SNRLHVRDAAAVRFPPHVRRGGARGRILRSVCRPADRGMGAHRSQAAQVPVAARLATLALTETGTTAQLEASAAVFGPRCRRGPQCTREPLPRAFYCPP